MSSEPILILHSFEGMFLTPPIILAKATGSALRLYASRYLKIGDMSILSVASVCILGESLLSVIVLTIAGSLGDHLAG